MTRVKQVGFLTRGLDSVIRRTKSLVSVGIDSVCFSTISINTCIKDVISVMVLSNGTRVIVRLVYNLH